MKISVVIASTTHLDRHYERLAKSALEMSAKKVNKVYVPYLINHDFSKQIGVVLSAKVYKLTDGEYGLLSVMGTFESSDERLKYALGEKNNVYREYEKLLDDTAKNLPDISPANEAVPPKNIGLAERLAIHLDSTKVSDTGEVYKIKRYIDSVGDLEIHVYPADHPDEKPGHFHIISKQRKINARFSITTLELMSNKQGFISRNDVKKIQNFFKLQPKALEKLRSEHQRLN